MNWLFRKAAGEAVKGCRLTLALKNTENVKTAVKNNRSMSVGEWIKVLVLMLFLYALLIIQAATRIMDDQWGYHTACGRDNKGY